MTEYQETVAKRMKNRMEKANHPDYFFDYKDLIRCRPVPECLKIFGHIVGDACHVFVLREEPAKDASYSRNNEFEWVTDIIERSMWDRPSGIIGDFPATVDEVKQMRKNGEKVFTHRYGGGEESFVYKLNIDFLIDIMEALREFYIIEPLRTQDPMIFVHPDKEWFGMILPIVKKDEEANE